MTTPRTVQLTKELCQRAKRLGKVARGDRRGARHFFGSGPTRARELGGDRVALMPYVTLAAFFPLAYLLWRRTF